MNKITSKAWAWASKPVHVYRGEVFALWGIFALTVLNAVI